MTGAARRAAEAGSRIAKRPRERRWGSRLSSAAATAEGEAPRSIRRRKWWGTTVLAAVSPVRHNGKSVRDVSPRRDAAERRSSVPTDWSHRHASHAGPIRGWARTQTEKEGRRERVCRDI